MITTAIVCVQVPRRSRPGWRADGFHPGASQLPWGGASRLLPLGAAQAIPRHRHQPGYVRGMVGAGCLALDAQRVVCLVGSLVGGVPGAWWMHTVYEAECTRHSGAFK